jgi:hypothetical protein
MCGIAGFIGASKNPDITYQIATKLFDRLEERGNDAAGFWATEPGDDGSVVFHKEPGASSKLIQQEIWRKTIAKMNLDLMVMHARRASTGADPKKNKNNHPFTSSDRSIALVHNGKLPEHHDLRKKYEVRSDTDSEVLLRIFEWASINTTQEEAQVELPSMDWITASKVMGLKKIFSYINTGVMASAVAERGTENGERTLWLFRNSMPHGQQDRPLYVIDVRDKLGQIFFCSTDVLWRKAMTDCPQARQFIGRRWCIEMPADEIWYFNTSNDVPVPDDSTCKKLDVTRGNVWRPLEDVGSPLPIIGCNTQPPFSIISYLNEHDDLNLEDMPKVAHKKRHKTTERWYPIGGSDNDMRSTSLMEIVEPGVHRLTEEESVNRDADFDINSYEDDDENFDLTTLSKFCTEIKRLASDIETTVQNKHMEGSMTASEFQNILEGLETSKLDMEGLLTIAEQE